MNGCDPLNEGKSNASIEVGFARALTVGEDVGFDSVSHAFARIGDRERDSVGGFVIGAE